MYSRLPTDNQDAQGCAAPPPTRGDPASIPRQNRGPPLALWRKAVSRCSSRAVEIHLTESGERMVAKMAQLHRDEHLNPAGSFLLPQLQDLQED